MLTVLLALMYFAHTTAFDPALRGDFNVLYYLARNSYLKKFVLSQAIKNVVCCQIMFRLLVISKKDSHVAEPVITV